MYKPLAHPSAPSPQSPDLSAIAAMLSEAAQALLNIGKAPETDTVETYDEDQVPSGPIEDGYKRGEFHEEIRCFRLPSFTVRQEYELLQQHEQGRFSHLVDRIHDDLSATVMLMRHIDESVEISGFELRLIGENLARPLDLLDTVCSQLADFNLVQKTSVPT